MIQIDVTIMGSPYKLACREGEEQALRQAVQYLDERMCTIRDAGKIKGTDRIAVMAALGMAAELLTAKVEGGPLSGMALTEIKQKIAFMQQVIEEAIAPQEKLF